MLSSQERLELVTAAKLYYEENLTQAEVAARLGVSRPTVSKMLTKAREVGIVHIEIRTSDEGNTDLLKNLQQRYGLQGGLVVADNKNFWHETAKFLHAELHYDHNIGLGWGYAVGETVRELLMMSARHQEGCIFPLIGTAHIPHKGYHPDELAQQWASVCGRTAYMLNCPAFPTSLEERSDFESSISYSEVAKLWKQADALVVSINGYPGVPDEATATRFGDALQQQKAVGKFLSYYYNARGEFISGNNDYCVHIPLATILKCRKVIGIAADNNIKAVLGAVKTGIITHLLLTESMARKLL